MAIVDRATRKTFFETGDKPSQSEFADDIDSSLSLADDSNINNGVKTKSQTNGKVEILWDDTFFQVTTDGGVFAEASLFMDVISSAFDNAGFQVVLAPGIGLVIRTPDTTPVTINVNGANTALFSRTAGGLNKFSFLLPTFADNAAALAGGLAINDLYKTAGGSVLIVV